MDIDLNKIKTLVSNDENELFYCCFNEKTVRFDMSTRKAAKRDYYIQAFNTFIDDHSRIISYVTLDSPLNTNLIKKSNASKKEASRLLSIVYEY